MSTDRKQRAEQLAPKGHRPIRFALLLALGVLLVSPALAQKERTKPTSEISDRFKIKISFVGTDTSTDLSAGGSGLGAVVRIEDVLGFKEDDSTVGLEGWYRFHAKTKGKHAIYFKLLDSRRESSGTVEIGPGDDPPDFFDETFIGSFKSEYNTQTLALGYRYSMLKTDKGEAGLLAGFNFLDYEFKISGEIESSGGGSGQTAEGADVLAPLPTFGVFFNYGVRHDLLFSMAVDVFRIDISDIEGRVLNTEAGLTWYFIRNLGIGIAIGGTDVEVTDNGSPFFKLDYRQSVYSVGFSGVF